MAVQAAMAPVQWGLRLSQTWWGRAAGGRAAAAAGQERLDRLVQHARTHSPFYAESLRDVRPGAAIGELPVTTRRLLMQRFDDWVTDRAVRRSDVDAFLENRHQVGERYLGRYVVWKSSGTSGEPGIYLQDDDALAIYDALIAVQLTRPDLSIRCMSGLMTQGGRAALVAATGDHFASIASWQRVCRGAPGIAARGFSIMAPLDRLVTDLNAFAPAYLASYPTMLAVLGDERAAGRLTIFPALVWSGGEYLSPPALAALEAAFDCPVVNEYGASECLSIAFGCRAGWLHVNSDWVLVEPVTAEHRPVPPGETSHTVLVTNLANRVQPIIRYDLGDAVLISPEPCTCGNPLPAMRVQGRQDDILRVRGDDGRERPLLPLAVTTVIEESSGLHRFQIVQSGPARLALRLDPDEVRRARHAAFESAANALREFLAQQGASNVTLVLDERAPRPDHASGKLRQVIREARDERARRGRPSPDAH